MGLGKIFFFWQERKLIHELASSDWHHERFVSPRVTTVQTLLNFGTGIVRSINILSRLHIWHLLV